jgi:hypothetical protein
MGESRKSKATYEGELILDKLDDNYRMKSSWVDDVLNFRLDIVLNDPILLGFMG